MQKVCVSKNISHAYANSTSYLHTHACFLCVLVCARWLHSSSLNRRRPSDIRMSIVALLRFGRPFVTLSVDIMDDKTHIAWYNIPPNRPHERTTNEFLWTWRTVAVGEGYRSGLQQQPPWNDLIHRLDTQPLTACR